MNGHPSVKLVPPLLLLAVESDASGEDLIMAYAAGFNVECTLAAPISPDHMRPTGTPPRFSAHSVPRLLLTLF